MCIRDSQTEVAAAEKHLLPMVAWQVREITRAVDDEERTNKVKFSDKFSLPGVNVRSRTPDNIGSLEKRVITRMNLKKQKLAQY